MHKNLEDLQECISLIIYRLKYYETNSIDLLQNTTTIIKLYSIVQNIILKSLKFLNNKNILYSYVLPNLKIYFLGQRCIYHHSNSSKTWPFKFWTRLFDSLKVWHVMKWWMMYRVHEVALINNPKMCSIQYWWISTAFLSYYNINTRNA